MSGMKKNNINNNHNVGINKQKTIKTFPKQKKKQFNHKKIFIILNLWFKPTY